jgi:glutamate-1-semialdehyde 2,1-aminomutase
MPIGAYGGRRDIMDHILPAGEVFQAGTLSGNPLATAAGIATLRQLRDGQIYTRLERLSARLENGLSKAASDLGISHTTNRVASMMTLFFNAQPVLCWEHAAKCDTKQFAKFFWGLLHRGVYFPCSQYEALFVSAAHTEDDIDRTIAAARESLADLAA